MADDGLSGTQPQAQGSETLNIEGFQAVMAKLLSAPPFNVTQLEVMPVTQGLDHLDMRFGARDLKALEHEIKQHRRDLVASLFPAPVYGNRQHIAVAKSGLNVTLNETSLDFPKNTGIMRVAFRSPLARDEFVQALSALYVDRIDVGSEQGKSRQAARGA